MQQHLEISRESFFKAIKSVTNDNSIDASANSSNVHDTLKKTEWIEFDYEFVVEIGEEADYDLEKDSRRKKRKNSYVYQYFKLLVLGLFDIN
ncbi:hypothetical protein Glove_74g248 [Diversispora epigaea]|uniref:Uncharacterized protein n=1 Tax=Diversispora epigaea TaxID=1348612 RepID=A0A397J9Y7_9GLOM|nr:hypothetical protein Glove_74g248 [Diversispora epigaea]